MKRREFSIKKPVLGFVFAGILASGLFLGVLALNNGNVLDTKAVENQELLDDEDYPSGGAWDGFEYGYEAYIPKSNVSGTRGLSKTTREYSESGAAVVQATERAYNTKNTISSVRVKNQGREGLCWAYSATTAIEYLLAKKGIQAEFSPKIIDYRFVDASEAYKENNVTNVYYNESGYNRSLGHGANSNMMLLVFADPLALTKESDFVRVIKENDSRLGELGITNTYDELWSKNYESVVTEVDDLKVYTTKQSYSKINDSNNASYVVTGMENITFPYYELSVDPDNSQIKRVDVIQDIKNAIKTYGAVTVHINTNNEKVNGSDEIRKCAYYSLPTIVYIDKGTEVCGDESGHFIALVGWDDDFSYMDGNVAKTGAFIAQNSYGNNNRNYYLSYDSALKARSYYDIERYDSHDNHYSLINYRPKTTTPTNAEHIFEFRSNKKERLAEITFSEAVSAKQYDVLISSKNTNNEYQKVNITSFSSHLGINKYEFEKDVIVDGDYKIKLLKTSGKGINDNNRKYNNVIVFTDDVYELSFNANGGNGTVSNQTCRPSNNVCELTVPNTSVTRSGYYFVGWAESKSSTEVKYRSGDKVSLSGDKVLYAVWANGKISWVDGNEYEKESGEGLVVKIDYPVSSFVSLKVDGRVVDNSQYSLESGSTVITIHDAYLDTLSVGKHTLSATYDGGVAFGSTFEIVDGIPVPNTSGADGGNSAAPNTGVVTDGDTGSFLCNVVMLPAAIMIVSVSFYVSRRMRGRLGFDHKGGKV